MTPPARRTAVIGSVLVASLMAAVLAGMGRLWWCKCGSPVPWAFDTWSTHNSQHILDPYVLSHVLHGVVFFAVLGWLHRRRAEVAWLVALTVEAGWEILENTPLVINRYRETTASLDYFGDSIANSEADLVACGVGYLIAARLPWWGAVLLFVGLELISVLWIRDSLLLNVLMLLSPVDAVRDWQMGG
ncbi:MAG: hypothetical protein ACI8PZ_005039 [Myxococcota bacterium]|jgi:hypothetical protein